MVPTVPAGKEVLVIEGGGPYRSAKVPFTPERVCPAARFTVPLYVTGPK